MLIGTNLSRAKNPQGYCFLCCQKCVVTSTFRSIFSCLKINITKFQIMFFNKFKNYYLNHKQKEQTINDLIWKIFGNKGRSFSCFVIRVRSLDSLPSSQDVNYNIQRTKICCHLFYYSYQDIYIMIHTKKKVGKVIFSQK